MRFLNGLKIPSVLGIFGPFLLKLKWQLLHQNVEYCIEVLYGLNPTV